MSTHPAPPRLGHSRRLCWGFGVPVLVLLAVAPGGARSGSAPAAAPAAAAAEQCTTCHAALVQKRVRHQALELNACTDCHQAASSVEGKCQSTKAKKWKVAQDAPELCYGCHDRKDKTKVVHSAVSGGMCLSCHTIHSSDEDALLAKPRDQLCFDCHDTSALLPKAVKHAPVTEGRCLQCHDPHGGERANSLRVQVDSDFCLKCHGAKAPAGKGTPGPRYRLDLARATVHPALEMGGCTGCHEAGHSSDNLRLLKKAPAQLCVDCHDRKDQAKFTHGAVLAGDCAVCHDPHASDQPKLLAKATIQQVCFTCHQDDVTGRKVIHAPVAKGCDRCHDPHGGPNRNALKGDGKALCYGCHKPMDDVKVKHAALERYGCTACHDPHASGNRFLVAKSVNELCAGCHPDQKDGTHATTIVAGGHVVGGSLLDPRHPDRAFTCASCHDPHGSDNPRLFYFGATPMQSCDGCHGDKTGQHPELKNVVSRARPKPVDVGAAGGGGGVTPGSGGAGGPGGGDGQAVPQR